MSMAVFKPSPNGEKWRIAPDAGQHPIGLMCALFSRKKGLKTHKYQLQREIEQTIRKNTQNSELGRSTNVKRFPL